MIPCQSSDGSRMIDWLICVLIMCQYASQVYVTGGLSERHLGPSIALLHRTHCVRVHRLEGWRYSQTPLPSQLISAWLSLISVLLSCPGTSASEPMRLSGRLTIKQGAEFSEELKNSSSPGFKSLSVNIQNLVRSHDFYFENCRRLQLLLWKTAGEWYLAKCLHSHRLKVQMVQNMSNEITSSHATWSQSCLWLVNRFPRRSVTARPSSPARFYPSGRINDIITDQFIKLF